MSLYTKIIDLQKLTEAWKKVRRNRPAAGVDEISYEEFDAGCREHLKQFWNWWSIGMNRYRSV